jgi:hypothetical protein
MTLASMNNCNRNQRRSNTNTFRFLRAYNDKARLYRFFNTKGKDGVTKIEKSSKPDPDPIYLNDYKAADEMGVYDE